MLGRQSSREMKLPGSSVRSMYWSSVHWPHSSSLGASRGEGKKKSLVPALTQLETQRGKQLKDTEAKQKSAANKINSAQLCVRNRGHEEKSAA